MINVVSQLFTATAVFLGFSVVWLWFWISMVQKTNRRGVAADIDQTAGLIIALVFGVSVTVVVLTA